jgi:hypothetical protein
MRWQCSERGCFNTKNRPKLELFADCFPRKISMSDVDSTVEVNGHFLFLEFKGGSPRELPTGQHLYLERLTRLDPKITAVVVHGDVETMEIYALRIISKGHFSDWETATLAELKARLRRWAIRANAKRMPARAAA